MPDKFFVGLWLIVWLMLAWAFFPAMLAMMRKKGNAGGIFVLFVAAALSWAVTSAIVFVVRCMVDFT